jgi:hypothetical protein
MEPTYQPHAAHPDNQQHAAQPSSTSRWRWVALSDLSSLEFARLIDAAGFHLWEHVGTGVLMLFDSDWSPRTHLPRPRRGNGTPFNWANPSEGWRPVQWLPSQAELMELFVAAYFRVFEVPGGELRLIEWDGSLRGQVIVSTRFTRGV